MEWNVSSELICHVYDHNQISATQISNILFGHWHLQRFKKKLRKFEEVDQSYY